MYIIDKHRNPNTQRLRVGSSSSTTSSRRLAGLPSTCTYTLHKTNIIKKLNPKLLLVATLVGLLSLAKPIHSTKCYACLFNLSRCTNPLDCYNQPDYCTNTNFSPLQSPVVECEFGCEQYIVTDPTGSKVKWHRGCAHEGSPKSSYICFSRNIYFLRHEQCWCHSDYCNSAPSQRHQLAGRLLLAVVTGALAALLAISSVCWSPYVLISSSGS